MKRPVGGGGGGGGGGGRQVVQVVWGVTCPVCEKSASTGSTASTGVAGARSALNTCRLPSTVYATGASPSAQALATMRSEPPDQAWRCALTGKYISRAVALAASCSTARSGEALSRATSFRALPPEAWRKFWNSTLCSTKVDRSNSRLTELRKAGSAIARASRRANRSIAARSEVWREREAVLGADPGSGGAVGLRSQAAIHTAAAIMPKRILNDMAPPWVVDGR